MAEVASEKENVVIAAGDCELTILPQFGGKIASIRVKGRELLQQPIGPMEPRTRTVGFDESDASGWDECLPSVAACSVPYAGGEAPIPDHGDVWRIAAEQRVQGSGVRCHEREDAPSLVWECFSLPLQLERGVALQETVSGWRISANYRLTNIGAAPAPWSWAAHPLFAVEPGDRLLLPESIRALRLEGSGGRRLGESGNRVAWPVARLADGDETDLSVAQRPQSKIGDKLFAGPLNAAENWAALERPSAGVRIRVGFDPEATPYLGLWLCYGGWPERPGPKQNCIALEPATAPVDSLATEGTWSRWLEPGESFDWAMTVDLELI